MDRLAMVDEFIVLGDRRSRVQISAARQVNLKFTLNVARTIRILDR